MKLICMEVLKKMTFSQKTFLTLSMVTLANRGHKTASRAAKRLSTGKPNASRVTSGYGGDMTPLSQVRLTQKNRLGSAGRFMAPIGQSHH